MAESKTMKKVGVDKIKNCLIIESDKRNLELEANNEEIVVALYDGVQEIVKNSKRMHLSYNF